MKKTQIRQRNPDSSDISLRSIEISPDPVKISPDLREISPESGFLRWILENYHWNMEILAGFWKYFGRFGFFGRKTATDPPESVSSSEDPLQTRQSSRVRRIRVESGRFFEWVRLPDQSGQP